MYRRRVSVLTDAKVEFGLIPRDHWYQPDWIDEQRATEGRNKMVADSVIYGGGSTIGEHCLYTNRWQGAFRKFLWRPVPQLPNFTVL